MNKSLLGRTGILVSRLCFGSLTISPLQADLTFEKGAEVINHALDRGINFIDTAEYYDNYNMIKKSLTDTNIRPVIATKSYAYTEEMAKRSIDKALNEMGIDNIDIFLLHEQESEYTLKGHMNAIEYFLKAKEQGMIKSFGISTHYIAGVKAATQADYIDVVHPIINIEGIGISDGSTKEMHEAIADCAKAGKGIYAMKIFGGGNLIAKYQDCFDYVDSIEGVNSIAIGMKNTKEVDFNIDYHLQHQFDKQEFEQISSTKGLHIEKHCILCKECIARCSSNALSLIDGKIVVDKSKCTLCGYCCKVCKDFAIKVI
jgi:predicted aldo/keto reductase-like oxidoreductase